MAELFQGRSVPLSGAGGAANALANAGGLEDFAKGVSDLLAARKQAAILDKRLADLGIDDRQAVAMGAPPPKTVTWGDNGSTLTTNPSAITVRELMLRRKLGAEPTLRDVLAPGAQLADDVNPFADAPVSVAEKLGPFIRGKTKPGGASGANDLTDPERVALFKAMEKGLVNPQQLTSRGNKTKLLAQKFLENPEYNAAAADTQFAGARSESVAAGGVRGGMGTKLQAAIDTQGSILQRLETLIPNLSPTQLQGINKAYRQGLKKLGDDAAATEVLTLLSDAAVEQAVINKRAQSSPTDVEIKKMRELFADGLGTGGIKGVRAAAEFTGRASIQALLGNKGGKGGASEGDGYQYKNTTDGVYRWKPGMKSWEKAK